ASSPPLYPDRPGTRWSSDSKTLYPSLLYFYLPYSTFAPRFLLNLYQCFPRRRGISHRSLLTTPGHPPFITRVLSNPRNVGAPTYHPDMQGESLSKERVRVKFLLDH